MCCVVLRTESWLIPSFPRDDSLRLPQAKSGASHASWLIVLYLILLTCACACIGGTLNGPAGLGWGNLGVPLNFGSRSWTGLEAHRCSDINKFCSTDNRTTSRMASLSQPSKGYMLRRLDHVYPCVACAKDLAAWIKPSTDMRNRTEAWIWLNI